MKADALEIFIPYRDSEFEEVTTAGSTLVLLLRTFTRPSRILREGRVIWKFCSVKSLKLKLNRKLHFTSRARARDLPEGGTSTRCVGPVKKRVVKEVEEFTSNLEPLSLPNLNILGQRQVEISRARSSY